MAIASDDPPLFALSPTPKAQQQWCKSRSQIKSGTDRRKCGWIQSWFGEIPLCFWGKGNTGSPKISGTSTRYTWNCRLTLVEILSLLSNTFLAVSGHFEKEYFAFN